MPNWKKVITSGSNASLSSLYTTNAITASIVSASQFSGSLFGTSSWANNTLTASYVNPLRQTVIITGSLISSGSNTFIGNQTVTGSLSTSGSNTLVGNTILSGSINISGSSTIKGTTIMTGSLLITGSTTQIGNNTLLGNTTLSGSITISGSFPVGSYSSSVNIYGDTTMTGYLKFNPQPTNIDTSISASYIFVSGSTNDLYFAQNTNGYNNITRLRWLEGNLYSGLFNGGLITTQSSTVYQVSSGSGVIISLNASLNDNPYPTAQYLNWGNLTSSIASLSASYDQQFVAINTAGQIFAQGVPYSDGDYNTKIPIGIVIHQNRSTINAVQTFPSLGYGWKQRSFDFIKAFGPLKISGYTLSPSGSSTGSLVLSGGTAWVDGRNYIVDPNNPSYITEATGITTSKIYRYYQSGSTYQSAWGYNTNGGAGYGVIDPTQYSNAGTLTPLLNNNKWSIQRVFYFPNSATKAFYIYYGNAQYDSKADAISAILTEPFNEAPNTTANAIFVGYMLLRKDADFTSTPTYEFRSAGLFRASGIGGSGGGGGTGATALSGLTDVSIIGETNGDLLVYDSTTTKWENKKTLSGSYTISDSLTITGSLIVEQITGSQVYVNLSSSAEIDVYVPPQTLVGSILFDPNNSDYLSLSPGANMYQFPGQGYLVNCWFRLTQDTFSDPDIAAPILWSTNNSTTNLYLYISSSLDRIVVNATTPLSFTTPYTIQKDTWYYLTVGYDAPGNTNFLYLNGTASVDTYSDAGGFTDVTDLIGTNGSGIYFPGYLTDVRLIGKPGAIFATTGSVPTSSLELTGEYDELLLSVTSSINYLNDTSGIQTVTAQGSPVAFYSTENPYNLFTPSIDYIWKFGTNGEFILPISGTIFNNDLTPYNAPTATYALTANYANSSNTSNTANYANSAGSATISTSPISIASANSGPNVLYSTNPSSTTPTLENGGSIFLGLLAGHIAISASYSNFIGTQAGQGATSASNSNFLGVRAGLYAKSASYSNLLGFNAGRNFDFTISNGIGSNNIIIGTNITLPNDRQDSINIGGLIFGTGSYSNISTQSSGSANGRIGINVVNPIYTLDVSGSGNYTNGLIVTGSLIATSFTGSLQGTASWATNALTASYGNITGSLFGTASWAVSASRATTSSFALTASFLSIGTYSITSSWATNAITSSYPISVTGSILYSTYPTAGPFNIMPGGLENSIFLGKEAGLSASFDVGQMVAIGYQAAYNTPGASFTTAVGYQSAYNARNSTGITAIGYQAGYSDTHAFTDQSVFIGNSSGYNASKANSSVFAGPFSGYQATSASYSTLIGLQVGYNFAGGASGIKSNNIIIGTNITLPNGTQDSINIGGLIFGTGSYSNISTQSSGSAGGRIGINVVSPKYTLDVSGSGNYTNGLTITGSLLVTGSSIDLNQSSLRNQNTSSLASGTKTISSNSTGSYTSAFYNYTLASGSNARAGNFMVVWNGASVQYTDVATLDIGSTSDVILTGSLSGGNINLSTNLPTSDWTIKTMVNLL